MVKEEPCFCDVNSIKVAREHKPLERYDLECKALLVVHRKPTRAPQLE